MASSNGAVHSRVLQRRERGCSSKIVRPSQKPERETSSEHFGPRVGAGGWRGQGQDEGQDMGQDIGGAEGGHGQGVVGGGGGGGPKCERRGFKRRSRA